MKIDNFYLQMLLQAFDAAESSSIDINTFISAGLANDEESLIGHLQYLDDEGYIARVDGKAGFGLRTSADGLYSWDVIPLRITSKGRFKLTSLTALNLDLNSKSDINSKNQSFSERVGISSKKHFQFDNVDANLRISLWNAIYTEIFELKAQENQSYMGMSNSELLEAHFSLREGNQAYKAQKDLKDKILAYLWKSVMRFDMSQMPHYEYERNEIVKNFLMTCNWASVYELLEGVFTACQSTKLKSKFSVVINKILEQENSAYRIKNGKVEQEVFSQTPIQSQKSVHVYGGSDLKMIYKKKLQVFISSTYEDLIDERQAAVMAILEAGHIPVGMELFTAGSEKVFDAIKHWIDESDVFMLLLGGRYGSFNEKAGKSYIHMEYEYASKINKPNFSLVLRDNALNEKVMKFNGDSKKVHEMAHRELYEKFKKEVTSKLCSMCNDVKDVKNEVMKSLLQYQNNPDLTGWVPGSVLSELNDLRLENERIKQDLKKN